MLLFIALASLVSITLGGMIAIKMRDRLHLILGFSAGSVVGVALFGLLPEAMAHGGDHAMIIVTLGFAGYMILDRFFSLHSHRDADCHNPRHDGRFGATALILHCLMDGIAIGVSLRISEMFGVSVALAILAHQCSDGINVVNMIVRDGGSVERIVKWLAGMICAVLCGIIVGNYTGLDPHQFGILLPIFAGTFLYIGMADLIPESHHSHPTIWTTVATIAGMGVICWVTTIGGGCH